MADELFSASGVSFGYSTERRLLADVGFHIGGGDFVGIIGPNGAGKTTLLSLLTGWLTPLAGTISYRGRNIGEWSRRAFAREVAVVPQSEDAAIHFSVEECILMGRYAHQHAMVGFEDEEDHAIARGVLALVDLEGFAHRRMADLSGGERQRVLVARALAQCPTVLMLDEPTSSLDPAHQRDLFNLLARLNRDHGLTIVCVTHDLNLAARYCDRVMIVANSGIAQDGPSGEVLRPEILADVFGVSMECVETPLGQRLFGWAP